MLLIQLNQYDLNVWLTFNKIHLIFCIKCKILIIKLFLYFYSIVIFKFLIKNKENYIKFSLYLLVLEKQYINERIKLHYFLLLSDSKIGIISQISNIYSNTNLWPNFDHWSIHNIIEQVRLFNVLRIINRKNT